MTEAAHLLAEPQHRLIYLCEKGVVLPDIQDAEGRGSSRRFSARNLLEFTLALRLRDLEVRASLVAAVVHVLRSFERGVASSLPGFKLPDSLRMDGAPDVRVVISDGRRLYFVMRDRSAWPRVFGGLDIRALESGKRTGHKVVEVRGGDEKQMGDGFGGPEGSAHTRVEVNVTRIAQELPLDR